MANKPQAKFNYSEGYGKKFKALRESKGLTQEQLGKALFYSNKTINLIECEKRPPTDEQLQRYHDYFKVSYDYLLGETEVKDISLQAICEYTGLSEDVIRKLHQAKERSTSYNELLSLILSKIDLDYFMGLVESYITADKEQSKINDNAPMPYRYSERDLAYFTFQNSLKMFLDSITSDYCLNHIPTKAKHFIRYKNNVLEQFPGSDTKRAELQSHLEKESEKMIAEIEKVGNQFFGYDFKIEWSKE